MRRSRRSATRSSWSAATGLWNVHVHVDDVGAAVEAGIEAGRPHRVRVTHFAEQAAAARAAHRRPHRPPDRGGRRRPTAWRRCSPRPAPRSSRAGPAAGRAPAGARRDPRHRGGRGRRPPQRRRLRPGRPDRRAHRRGRRGRPGRGDPHPGAGAGPRRARGPRAGPQLRPGRPRDDRDRPPRPPRRRHGRGASRRSRWPARASPATSWAWSRATSRWSATTSSAVAVDVLERLLGGGGELVTVVAGGEGPTDLADRCAAYVEEHHPHVDVLVYDGGQDRYPLLVAVE